MFGVLMSVQPLNPTSFQPRSSATIWTKLCLFSAAFARATAPNSASTLVSAAAMRFWLGLTFIIVSFLCLPGSVISLRCGCWKQNLLSFQGAAPWTAKLNQRQTNRSLWLPEQLNTCCRLPGLWRKGRRWPRCFLAQRPGGDAGCQLDVG